MCYNFNLSSSFVTNCSDFLATRAEQSFNMRRIAEIGLQIPESDKYFLVLVIVLVVKSEVLYCLQEWKLSLKFTVWWDNKSAATHVHCPFTSQLVPINVKLACEQALGAMEGERKGEGLYDREASLIKKEYCRCGPHPLQVTSSRARPPLVKGAGHIGPLFPEFRGWPLWFMASIALRGL